MSILPIFLASALTFCLQDVYAAQALNYEGKLIFAVTSNVDAVSFESEVTGFEKMQANLEGNALKGLEVELDPSTFETGMSMRDDHMNEKVFAEKPVRFSFKECTQTTATSCLLKGEIEIAGKKTPMEIPLKHDEGFKNVSGQTKLSLKNLKIEAPSYMGVRIEDTIDVKFDLKGK